MRTKGAARRVVGLLLGAVLLAGGLSGCGEKRPGEDIVRELVLYRGCYGRSAAERERELLDELARTDSRQGALWERIMDCWTQADADFPVNIGALPEDLPRDGSLAIVVLGYALNSDGSMRPELLGRLGAALACAEQYPEACVVCTGGGTAQNAPGITEAGQMGRWLLERGLAEERLILEDASLTTAENALFSRRLLLAERPQVSAVALVSSSYHIPWGALLFESAFLKAAAEDGAPELHVISNCAYPTENPAFPAEELLRWQTGGMLQLIGENDLALKFYYDYESVPKPPL